MNPCPPWHGLQCRFIMKIILPLLLAWCCLFVSNTKAKNESKSTFAGEGFVPGLIIPFHPDEDAPHKIGIQYPCRPSRKLDDGCKLEAGKDKWKYKCCNGVCDRTKRYAPLKCPKFQGPPGRLTQCYFCTETVGDQKPGWCATDPKSHSDDAVITCDDSLPFCSVSYYVGQSGQASLYRGCGDKPQGCVDIEGGLSKKCHCDSHYCNDKKCQDPQDPWKPVPCQQQPAIDCFNCEAKYDDPQTFDCKDNPQNLKKCAVNEVCRTLSYVSTRRKESVLKRECVTMDRFRDQCYQTATNLPQDASPGNPSCECICDQGNCNKKVPFGAGWNACATAAPPPEQSRRKGRY